MEGKIKVLYLDDEQNNLLSFKAAFRRDYTVLTALRPDEAFRHLEEHRDITVVISDQRMPEKSGVEFFEELRVQYPMPVRMLCTGYTDVEAVIAAINRGHVFRYIQKPWSETDIRFAIEEGHKYFVATSLLEETNRELLKANTELDKFSHSVTHELRSPILSVMGAINIAQSTDNVAEIKEMLSLAGKAMQRLDNFIYNMHDYYTIQRGKLNTAVIDFDKLISDLTDIYTIAGKTNNVRFEISNEVMEEVNSDQTVLNIILSNLISNAFKYQSKTRVDRFVKLVIRTEEGKCIIEVSDNGIGINEAHLDNIFDMFFRATNEEFGSGFGLYNVKDALKKLNGEIKVSSARNEGSLFTVTIPNP